jgi:hypothetical protein
MIRIYLEPETEMLSPILFNASTIVFILLSLVFHFCNKPSYDLLFYKVFYNYGLGT